MQWFKRRIFSFVLIYSAVMAALVFTLYARYESLCDDYIDTRTHEFNQQIESYQLMQQKMIQNYYGLFLDSPEITSIMAEAVHSDSARQAQLRGKLKNRTEAMFGSLKNFDVRLLFFHLPDAIGFLRLHKPEQFGDSLAHARPSVVMAQKSRQKVVAFETGKIFDGFRTIYPLFHHQKFVGTVEIAYPFLALKKQALRQGSGAYTFLIKRSVQENKATAQQMSQSYRNSFGSEYIEDKESALEEGAIGFEKGELEGLLSANRTVIEKALSEGKLQGIKLFYKGSYSLMVLKPVIEIGGKQTAYMVEITPGHTFFAKQLDQFVQLLLWSAILLALLMWYIYRYNRSVLVLEQYKNAIDENMIVSKTDRRGVITYVNPRFCEISGLSEDEVIGKFHNIVRHPDTSSLIFQEMWNTIQEGKIWHGAIHNRTKNGESYYVNSTVCPIKDENGEVIEYIGLGEDVTEFVKSKQREQLLRLDAQRSELAKAEFLANMSHEIRTPLNGIMGFAKLLSDADLPNESHRRAVIIAEQSKTLMGIINDILDLSKIESGNLSLERMVINPFVEFENAFSLFVPIAQEKKIEYRVRLDSVIGESINMDILRLKQVMSNLISNALKFTPEGGAVTVEVTKEQSTSNKDRLRFSVSDTGIGIASEKLATIFSPFTQEDSSTTREFGGTGLGLSISSKLVELFGGELKVESEKGKGSRFWFDMEVERADQSAVIAEKLETMNVGIVQSDSPYFGSVKAQLEAFKISYHECLESVIDTMEEGCNLAIVFEERLLDKLLAKPDDYFSHIILIGSASRNYPHRVTVIGDYDNCPSRLYNTLLSIGLGGVHKRSFDSGEKEWQEARVLVAEDYEVNRMLIEALLEIHGIVPDFAVNGKEACAMIESNSYDLVFMDVNMPVMDGIEATRTIRAGHPDLPIIALTANALKGDKERFVSEGMSDYLSKPIDPDALVAVLEQFLGEPSSKVPSESSLAEEDLYATARQALNLPDEVIYRVFDLFESSIPPRLKALNEAIESMDYNAIKDQAHAIKGASGNLWLNRISEIAAAIEHHALEKEAVEFRRLFEELEKSFNDFRQLHAIEQKRRTKI